MRIATCGGETGWRCFFLAHLAAEWISRGHQALVVDATPDQELIKHLEVSPSLLSRLPRLGEEGFRLKEYVAGQGVVRPSAITENSNPNSRSRQIECSEDDPFFRCFSAEISYPRLHTDLTTPTVRLISLGSCDEGDIVSLRRHHQALSIFLNHLADSPEDGVFIHLNSGQLPCITGVLGRIDLALLVDEATPTSTKEPFLARNITRSIQQTLDRLRTPTITLNARTRVDRESSWLDKDGAGGATTVQLLSQTVLLSLPHSKPEEFTTWEAIEVMSDVAESTERDPSRFARTNELMARVGDSLTEDSSVAVS